MRVQKTKQKSCTKTVPWRMNWMHHYFLQQSWNLLMSHWLTHLSVTDSNNSYHCPQFCVSYSTSQQSMCNKHIWMQELNTYMHSVSVFKYHLVKSIYQVFIKELYVQQCISGKVICGKCRYGWKNISLMNQLCCLKTIWNRDMYFWGSKYQ